MNLTTADINMLMEALDALKSKKTLGELLVTTLTASIAPPQERKGILDRAHEKFETLKQNEKALGEKIVLLKAKLIQMRDKAMIEEMEI